MGLLNWLTLPAIGPIRGVAWIAQKAVDEAEREIYDEETIRGRLQELEMRYDLGEISEEEYLEGEDALLARLRDAREHFAAT